MNKYFKALILIAVIPLLSLLTGCNSEDAFSESIVKLKRIDIVLSPTTTKGVSQLRLATGIKQSFEAVGHFSDGSSRTLADLNVSDWHTSASDVGRFDKPGVFTATNEGHTTLTATKDGVTSNTVEIKVEVEVTVCTDLAGACIDIFDTGNGKLLTNSPSVAYLDSIDGSVDIDGKSMTDGTYTETGSSGHAGDFYRFNWPNAEKLCRTYNTHSLGGRDNWRLATIEELKKIELYSTSENRFTARGWPTAYYYWSMTSIGGPVYEIFSFQDGHTEPDIESSRRYVSCISNPQS